MENESIIEHGLRTVKDYKVVKRVLKSAELVGKNNKVLDIGIRTGECAQFYDKSNELTGIDLFPEFIDKINLEGNFFVWDAEQGLSCFEDNCFDVVVIGETLEYFHEWDKCMSEIYRVLKPEGRLIINEINQYSLRRRLKFLFAKEFDEPKHYIHLFKDKELKNIIENNKFKVTRWINFGPTVKNIKLPLSSKGLCDTWIIECKK